MFEQIFNSTLQILSSFYITLVLLRFLLQFARADFYNPISQFIVRATTPLLKPLRKFIPGWGGIDGASLVLAIGLQFLTFLLLLMVQGFYSFNPVTLIAWAAVTVLSLIIKIYYWGIIISIILSWVAQGSNHPAVVLVYQITEPVMRPFRRILPPIGGLDLSPILVFLVLNVVQIMVGHLAAAVGML
jgi:YggT family protein